MTGHVTLRFYAELNDHLPDAGREVVCHVGKEEAVGGLVESCGVPLAEVDLLVVAGESVGPDHPVGPGDRVGVYPVFEAFDIGPVAELANRPLRFTRFLVAADLAPLAESLRERGYDALVSVVLPTGPGGQAGGRILLTTDPMILADPLVTHAVVVRGESPTEQVAEVAARLHLR